MWFLRGPKSKFKIDGRRLLGRDNFPKDKLVSEQHVELRVIENHLYIFDLGSMNGTFINDLQLLPGVRGELKHGNRLRIGETELRAELDADYVDPSTIEPVEESDIAWPAISVIVYAVVLLIYFSMPAMAYGKSIGSSLSLIVAGLLALATALVAFPLAAVLMGMKDPILRYSLFAVSLGAGSFLAFTLMLSVFDDQWPIAQRLLGAKINYFCKVRFQDHLCAEQIAQCPACMAVVERFNLQKKAEEEHLFNPPIPPAMTPRRPIVNPGAEIQ